MDRRGFLQTSAAALAAGMMGRGAEAQAPGTPQQSAAPAETSLAPSGKLRVDAYSRHLQWLRTADEVAEATIEMAFKGVDITVRPYPGHVDPARVSTDLPPFVKTIRKHGLEVSMITCPITDADSPNAEKILQTASSLGINHYWWGTFRYEPGIPVMQQLDALKPRVEKLAKLNEKYNMKAMYHTYSMPGTVGCNVWDFLGVLRNFDPRYVSFHWDAGHTSVTGGNDTWANSMRASGPYVGGLAVKAYTWDLELETPEGGPFTGKPADLERRLRFGPGGPGGPGGARGPEGRGGAQGAPGGGRPPASPEAEQEAAERGMGEPGSGANRPGVAANPGQGVQQRRSGGGAPGSGAPGAGRPEAGGPGGRAPGGRGGPGERFGARGPLPRGGGGQPLPWRTRAVPLGEGIDNLPLLASILKEIQFQGPVEIQAEYPNGGANDAQDKITLPRIMVLGAMKRDLLTLEAGFAGSGLL